jgi:hypothetical protein
MKTLLIGTCALALLAGCGKRDEPAAAAPSAYKLLLLPLVAGTYGGNCLNLAGTAASEGVTIDRAGHARASAWQAELTGPTDMFMLSRTVEPGKPAAASNRLACAGAAGSSELSVTTSKTGLEIEGQAYSFEHGVSAETASVDGDTLVHKVAYANTDKLSVTLDAHGKLAQLIAAGKDGRNYTCAAPPA